MGLRDIVDKRRAERERPKSLRELRERKQAERQKQADPRTNGLAALRKSKLAKQSSKLDFTQGGLRYHNVQQQNGWWTVDVSNNDRTYTLHNRHGAWFHNVEGHEGRMVEPVRVARALGTNVGQLEISQALIERLERELKMRGLRRK
jgi:hypothetical protein